MNRMADTVDVDYIDGLEDAAAVVAGLPRYTSDTGDMSYQAGFNDGRYDAWKAIKAAVAEERANPPELRLKDVVCPQCRKAFRLNWNDYSNFAGEKQTLMMSGCPSGGIYAVKIACPHCDYEEAL